MKKSKLYQYLLDNKKKTVNVNKIKELKKYFYKTFKNSENIKNKNILKKYSKYFTSKYFVSDNVLITKNIHLFLNKIEDENNFFISSKIGYDYFNKIYNNYLKLKKNFFFEKIKSKNDLIKIIKLLKNKKVNLICIGGGQVSDMAKFISLKTNTNLITIPTILATHVYASPKIHVLDPIKQMGFRLTIDGKSSNLSIIDLNIIQKTFKENSRLIFSGMGDLMAFYNSKHDWFLSNKFKKEKNIFLIESIFKVEKILETINIKKPLNAWIKKYIFAQVLLCNITDWVGSAPASGTEHFFANLYEKKFPSKALHGELVALGTLIFTFIRGADYKNITLLMKKFKINKSIINLNITKSEIITILSKCKNEGARKSRFSLLNKRNLTRDNFKFYITQMIQKKILVLK